MRALLLAKFSVLASLTVACSTLGPKANVSLIKSEQKSTKTVDNILIPNVTGIDSTGNTGKALLGNAIKAYGGRSRPVAAAGAVLSGVGAPDGLADLLAATYQAEFMKAVNAYVDGGGKKRPEQLALPSGELGMKLPAGLEGLKKMVPKLQEEAATFGELAKSLRAGNSQGFIDALGKSENAVALVRKMDEFLFDKLDVTYVLLTHVVGDEAAWNGGKKVQYAAALVNVKTGKLRWFATVEAKKGAIPTPYMAQLGIMSNNLFDAAVEQDPLPEAAEAKGEPKKKKKTAQIEIMMY